MKNYIDLIIPRGGKSLVKKVLKKATTSIIGHYEGLCHVYVDKEWQPKLNPIEEDEESMLDQTFEVKNNSRLSCQIEYKKELNGIKLKIAPE